jgi:phosphate transport system substrate-binding protein
MTRLALAPVVALVLAVAAARPAPTHAAKRPPTITLSGTQVVQSVLADLAYFYRHSVRNPPRFAFLPGGTSTGVSDAQRGVVEGGLLARNLGGTDPPGMVLTPFALSGLCMITNRSNPVPDFPRAIIQQIFTGQVTNWSQVPGSNRVDPIIPAGAIISSAASAYWASVFLDPGMRITYAPRRFTTTAQVVDFVRATPAGFGYADLSEVQGVHAGTYQGIGCSAANLRNATYPAQRPLGVVTKGQPRGALKRFLRWVRTSPKARQVIATRYIPLQTKEM